MLTRSVACQIKDLAVARFASASAFARRASPTTTHTRRKNRAAVNNASLWQC